MKLHEDKQFTPSTAAVSRILKEYDLELTSFQPATSGIENCTLLISASGTQYVLRVYRRQKKSDVEIHQELAFIQHLSANGISVVPALANKSGSLLTRIDDWQAVLMDFVTSGHAPNYTMPLLENMAQSQAKMHMLAGTFPNTFEVSNELFRSNETYRIKPSSRPVGADASLQEFISRMEQYVVPLKDDLPTGLYHLDYGKGNVLSDNSGRITAILDFDDLAEAPYVTCLGHTLWDIAIQDDETLVEYYYNVYASTRSLSDYERLLVPKMMLFRNYVIASDRLSWNRFDKNQQRIHLKIEHMLLSGDYHF